MRPGRASTDPMLSLFLVAEAEEVGVELHRLPLRSYLRVPECPIQTFAAPASAALKLQASLFIQGYR